MTIIEKTDVGSAIADELGLIAQVQSCEAVTEEPTPVEISPVEKYLQATTNIGVDTKKVIADFDKLFAQIELMVTERIKFNITSSRVMRSSAIRLSRQDVERDLMDGDPAITIEIAKRKSLSSVRNMIVTKALSMIRVTLFDIYVSKAVYGNRDLDEASDFFDKVSVDDLSVFINNQTVEALSRLSSSVTFNVDYCPVGDIPSIQTASSDTDADVTRIKSELKAAIPNYPMGLFYGMSSNPRAAEIYRINDVDSVEDVTPFRTYEILEGVNPKPFDQNPDLYKGYGQHETLRLMMDVAMRMRAVRVKLHEIFTKEYNVDPKYLADIDFYNPKDDYLFKESSSYSNSDMYPYSHYINKIGASHLDHVYTKLMAETNKSIDVVKKTLDEQIKLDDYPTTKIRDLEERLSVLRRFARNISEYHRAMKSGTIFSTNRYHRMMGFTPAHCVTTRNSPVEPLVAMLFGGNLSENAYGKVFSRQNARATFAHRHESQILDKESNNASASIYAKTSAFRIFCNTVCGNFHSTTVNGLDTLSKTTINSLLTERLGYNFEDSDTLNDEETTDDMLTIKYVSAYLSAYVINGKSSRPYDDERFNHITQTLQEMDVDLQSLVSTVANQMAYASDLSVMSAPIDYESRINVDTEITADPLNKIKDFVSEFLAYQQELFLAEFNIWSLFTNVRVTDQFANTSHDILMMRKPAAMYSILSREIIKAAKLDIPFENKLSMTGLLDGYYRSVHSGYPDEPSSFFVKLPFTKAAKLMYGDFVGDFELERLALTVLPTYRIESATDYDLVASTTEEGFEYATTAVYQKAKGYSNTQMMKSQPNSCMRYPTTDTASDALKAYHSNRHFFRFRDENYPVTEVLTFKPTDTVKHPTAFYANGDFISFHIEEKAATRLLNCRSVCGVIDLQRTYDVVDYYDAETNKIVYKKVDITTLFSTYANYNVTYGDLRNLVENYDYVFSFGPLYGVSGGGFIFLVNKVKAFLANVSADDPEFGKYHGKRIHFAGIYNEPVLGLTHFPWVALRGNHMQNLIGKLGQHTMLTFSPYIDHQAGIVYPENGQVEFGLQDYKKLTTAFCKMRYSGNEITSEPLMNELVKQHPAWGFLKKGSRFYDKLSGTMSRYIDYCYSDEKLSITRRMFKQSAAIQQLAVREVFRNSNQPDYLEFQSTNGGYSDDHSIEPDGFDSLGRLKFHFSPMTSNSSSTKGNRLLVRDFDFSISPCCGTPILSSSVNGHCPFCNTKIESLIQEVVAEPVTDPAAKPVPDATKLTTKEQQHKYFFVDTIYSQRSRRYDVPPYQQAVRDMHGRFTHINTDIPPWEDDGDDL